MPNYVLEPPSLSSSGLCRFSWAAILVVFAALPLRELFRKFEKKPNQPPSQLGIGPLVKTPALHQPAFWWPVFTRVDRRHVLGYF